MEAASDNGMGPIGETPDTNFVGGLVAEVEKKMAELMAWHAQQVKQLETDKVVLKTQADEQQRAFVEKSKARREEIDAEKKTLSKNLCEIEDQRVKLAALANKLRAEENAMSREWGEVQREREALQKQSVEVAKLREEVQDRAKAWLNTAAKELSEPLKLAGTEKLPQRNEAA
jgi:seryl-tRNA synthetase